MGPWAIPPRRAKPGHFGLPTAVLSFVLSALAASYDPKLDWQTLPTEHFEINYHNGEEQLAAEMAVSAEEAYAILTADIRHESRRKVQITLIDWTDSANGYASIAPYNAIVIYVTAPQEDSTLGLYTDWSTLIKFQRTHDPRPLEERSYGDVARQLAGWRAVLRRLDDPVRAVGGGERIEIQPPQHPSRDFPHVGFVINEQNGFFLPAKFHRCFWDKFSVSARAVGGQIRGERRALSGLRLNV